MQEPRSDFIEYCNDLHRVSGGFFHPSFLKNKAGFSFSELFDALAFYYPTVLTDCRSADYSIVVHAAAEYDPLYSHIHPYLAQQYAIHCDSVDIAEQGILSVVTALHLLNAFFESKKIHRAMILGFDQCCLPVTCHAQPILPALNGVALLSLSRVFNVDTVNLKCLHAEMVIITDFETHIAQFVLQLQQQYQTVQHVEIFCYFLTTSPGEKNSFQILSGLKLLKHKLNYGVTSLFLFLDQLQKAAMLHASGTVYALFIEDAQMGEQGLVVFKKE
ncbi:MAG: hypothetical protein COY58_01350 [Gammaproteobacteria bacterium CG_4_10_14_0_8_um_filter_38_16]|nr:MAG: hypothetical protein COY58_01350 [Gammaproteobacteria bacterium CG_4_10_14_0_8_um_filter_38_16]PJB10268.1 MAG: hypothetical protein CO120_05740 [Gammaproteobacteria bacterium CG_4_9_14_3_um_filter_38_9]